MSKAKNTTNKKKTTPAPPDLRHCIAQCSDTCHKQKGDRSYTHFYKSSGNLIHDENIPICKDCLYALTHDEGKFVKSKFLKILPIIDKPYIEDTMEQSRASMERNDRDNILGEYFRLLMLTNPEATFENSDEDFHTMLKKARDDENPFDINVTDKLKIKWGSWRDESEIRFLEHRYREYDKFYDVNSDPVTKGLVMDICVTELEIDSARMNHGKTKDLIETKNKLLSSAYMKPVQTQNSKSGFNVGDWIKNWEEHDPITDPLPEFKDPDNIWKYFNKYFKHLIKMFGR